ncbi:MAG: ribosome maturation factor RimM, partial [Desulfobulbaceae bacterium]|nr:ribosome maturation factor RimM [Desulfobulbaceae bacterium]
MTLGTSGPTQYIAVGKIAKAHGIRGEVKIYPYSGQPENFLQYKKVYLHGRGNNGLHSLEIEQCRVQSNIILAKFKNICTRNDAESLLGLEISIKNSELPPLGDGEYYYHEFIDKSVKTREGRILGRVHNIFDNGAHDILEVHDGKREYLIPLLDEFIVMVG